jgi:hypothetical protein
MRQKTFKEKTILHAWHKAGLFPYDPKVPIQRMKQYKDPEPPLPPLVLESNAILSTPKDLKHSQQSAEQWKKKLEKVLSSPSKERFDRYTKGTEIQLLHAQITKQEIVQIHLAFKENLKAGDKARKYTVGTAPMKVKAGLAAIQEKDARQRKSIKKEPGKEPRKVGNRKGKAIGKAKSLATSSFVLDLESDDDDSMIQAQLEHPELEGFSFGDQVPDPFVDSSDFVGFS